MKSQTSDYKTSLEAFNPIYKQFYHDDYIPYKSKLVSSKNDKFFKSQMMFLKFKKY